VDTEDAMSVVALPILFLLALLLLGVLTGVVVLLSHPKTRKATLIVGGVVGMLIFLGLAGIFVVRFSNSVVRQPQQVFCYPTSVPQQGQPKGDSRESMEMYQTVYESSQGNQPAPDYPTSPSPQADKSAALAANGSGNPSLEQFDTIMQSHEATAQETPATAPISPSSNPTPADAAAKREEELSQAAASKMMSVFHTAARVLVWALAEEEKILAAKKETEKPSTTLAEKPAADQGGGAGTQPALTQAEKGPNPRPAWVNAPPQLIGDVYQMSISVGPYTTRAECDAKLPDELQAALGQYVQACLGGQATLRDINLPPDYLRQQVVKAEWQEDRAYSVGPMTQLHLLLKFDRKVKDRVLEEHRRVVVDERLWVAGVWAAIGLGLLTAAFGYLKLDLATGGIYRRRLRWLAGTVILVGVIAVAVAAMV
jgi:hypothetical protein